MVPDLVPVPELIWRQAARTPGTVAVEAAGDRLTYAELLRRATGLAEHLGQIGVRPGDVVAVALPRGVDLIPALLGVQLAGAAYLPLDPEHPSDRLTHVLADAGARVLVVAGAAAVPGLPAEVRVRLADVPVRSGPTPLPPLPPAPTRLDATAYVIFTSGSTGRPKGVQITHRALANFIASMWDRPGLPADVVLPAVTTVSFDIAGLELFLPLTTGGRVVIARDGEAADPRQLRALLARTGARALQATPVTWRLLLEAGWTPPRGFTVLCGGERLPTDLADRLLGADVVLWDLYGPTETTIWSAVTRYERGRPPRFDPVQDTTLRLLDGRLEPVPTGTAGELYIGGAGLAVGYLGRPGLTATRFVADPSAHGERLYRTGDVVRRLADGRLAILGRSDDQVKIRGFRIEPGEIETLLARHPDVAEAVVTAVGGPRTEVTAGADSVAGVARLVCYLRPADPAHPPAPDGLRRHLARSVPAYMIPAQFVVLDAFPTTPNGKLDRAALPVPPDPTAPHATVSEPTVPEPSPAGPTPTDTAGELQQRVATVLAAVLDRPAIGPHEDFFALGGDSLRAVQVILHLNAELQTQVPINALFEARTVYGLAALLDGDGVGEPALRPLPADRTPPLSSAQWRLWLHQRLVPHSVADNQPLAVALPEPLDLAAARAAVTDLLARHELLRTGYPPDHNGQPVPVARPVAPIELTVETGDPARVLAAELARPFDLAVEPPVRIRLVRGPDGPAHLLVVVHEIAADARSRELIADQLRATSRGRPVPTPALRYADYAAWQRELALSPSTRRHLDFWRTTLAGLRAAGLRTDRPRPAGRDWQGATVHFELPPPVVDPLRDLAFDQHATVSMGLLAAFCAVLGRYVDGTDLTIGVPVAGRNRPELEDVVGPIEGTAVIRVDLGDQPTFGQLLGRVRESGLAAFGRAALPLEDIVAAAIDETPAAGRHPLFDVMFVPHGVTDRPGFPLPAPPGTRFDLCCDLTERANGGVDGQLHYATQLFDEATITRLAADYVQVLVEVGADPDRPIAPATLADHH